MAHGVNFSEGLIEVGAKIMHEKSIVDIHPVFIRMNLGFSDAGNLQALPGEALDPHLRFLGIHRWAIPVSYTHLDVYKRQG